jgi:hypothetical protein
MPLAKSPLKPAGKKSAPLSIHPGILQKIFIFNLK